MTDSLHRLSAAMAAVYLNLRDVRAHWQDVSGENAVRDAIGKIFVQLTSAAGFLRQAEQEAMAVKANANKAYRLIDTHIAEAREAIQAAVATMQEANRRIDVARMQLDAARSELDGWKGFGNGLALVLSFGGYNAVQENINKANMAVATAHAERNRAEMALRQLQRSETELAASAVAITQISDLDKVITAVSNDISAGISALTDADEAVTRAELRAGMPLGRYYLARAKPQMDKVIAWADQPSPFN
ncbi:MAG: hypothetical protein AB7E78_16180 [Porticoccaceae bacterium]